MFGCLGLVIGIWGGFVVEVITAITDYLDIWYVPIILRLHELLGTDSFGEHANMRIVIGVSRSSIPCLFTLRERAGRSSRRRS